MKKSSSFKFSVWLGIAVLSLFQSVNVISAELLLKVTEIDGTHQYISVADGLKLSFSPNSLTIYNDGHSLSYSLENVSRITYVIDDKPSVSIDAIRKDSRISVSTEGIAVSLPGIHRLTLVTITGQVIFSDEFTDNINILRNEYPAGLAVLIIDNSLSIKIYSK